MTSVKRGSRLVAGALAISAAALLPGVSASASPARAANTPIPSYSYVGPLTPRDNPHWCLTAGGPPFRDGSPVLVRPCVKNDLEQQWFAGRIGNIGEIGFVSAAQLRMAALRTLISTAYLTDAENHPNPRKYNWTLLFSNVHGLWKVETVVGRGRTVYLTLPSHLKAGTRRPVSATWAGVQPAGGKWDQLWHFHWVRNAS